MLSAGNSYYAIGATPWFQKEGVNYRTLEDWRTLTGWEIFQVKPTGQIIDPKWQSPDYSARTVGIGGIDQLAEKLAGWRLQASSPVIDAGVDLRAAALPAALRPLGVDFFNDTAPQGAVYDVGACEAH